MLFTKILPTQGDSIEDILSRAMTMTDRVRAAKKGVDAFDRVVRRAMGRTGSDLFTGLKKAFKDNSLNLEEKQIYSETGVVKTRVLQNTRPYELYTGFRPKKLRSPGRIGGKFSPMMQYQMNFDGNRKDLEVGLIPSRRGGQKWADRFREWQKGGPINLGMFNNYMPDSMRGYFAAVGMPIRRGMTPTRPARPAIERYRNQQNPVQMFERAFLERLRR